MLIYRERFVLCTLIFIHFKVIALMNEEVPLSIIE